MYDLIIIGGGAAGMMAAAHTKGLNSLLLEGEKKLLQKLEISGSGRCNLTHNEPMSEFFHRYGIGKERFVKKALTNFDNSDTVEFFNARGVETVILENDKIFPKAENAHVLSNVLIGQAQKCGATLKTGSKVIGISKDGEKGHFEVVTEDGERYKSLNLLITTGGKSFFNTGSDGSGFKLAAMMGHSIVKPRPCLAPVFVDLKKFPRLSDIAGTSFEGVDIRLLKKQDDFKPNEKMKFHGMMVVTHKGLSGPVILDASRYFEEGDRILVNFSKGCKSPKEVEGDMIAAASSNGKQKASTFMKNAAATLRLGEYIFSVSGLSKDFELSVLPKNERVQIAKLLCLHSFEISRVGGFEMAMATAGGVDIKEVKAGTMESRLVDGLYFAGEVLDIDGDTGGYNIQWAFSSGVMAVRSIKER